MLQVANVEVRLLVPKQTILYVFLELVSNFCNTGEILYYLFNPVLSSNFKPTGLVVLIQTFNRLS